MKEFMSDDFLLSTQCARELFEACRYEPIFDWHCHLSPKEIYENKSPENLTELWLGGDHYKWRAMRSAGTDEKYITGSAPDYDKFTAWARVIVQCIGNPLYHWTHLELRRYFGIEKPLSPNTADEIWHETKKMIADGGFTPRELIERSNVVCVCTTDDPADDLEYHRLIALDESFKCKVLPAFRPDKFLHIDKPEFVSQIAKLESASGKKIDSFEALKGVLLERTELFAQRGCRAADHSLAYMPSLRADKDELERIFRCALAAEHISKDDADKYKTELMLFLAKEYHRRGWVMELHLGALRNNNTLMFNRLGADAGFDSMDDLCQAQSLSRFLDMLACEEQLPKTVLFTLNPKDNYTLGSMMGNFQNSDAVSKIQFGSAWWFNDNIDGMRAQLSAFANLGVIGGFIGMITDSRSFLSYPRHEYFRRILCEYFGSLAENGEYPYPDGALTQAVKNISYYNAKNYFGLEV